jgi:FkbM family methyltransferase
MEPTAGKPGCLKNVLVRLLLFGVFIIVVRFAYVVTITGESCNVGDFCFFSLPETFNFVIAGAGTGASAIAATDAVKATNGGDLYTSKDWIKAVHYYSSVFQDLITEGRLSPGSKALCVETSTGQDVYALRQIGVRDSIGIFKKASRPLVIKALPNKVPFGDNTLDFVFSGGARLDKASRPSDLASEIERTLKPEGFLVVHIGAKDTYSFNSFLELFNSCELIKSRDIDGLDSLTPQIREVVLRKRVETDNLGRGFEKPEPDGNSENKCLVPGHKRELVRKAEPLITEEPLKPWITLKRNIKKIMYLPSMADISFKNRYVYIDVGARSYGSSIGSWFRKQYPKQNRTFEVYAIEADKAFHEEYRMKKKVSLLPYAAWVRNETLLFEVNHDPGKSDVDDKGRGMGRIRHLSGGGGNGSEVNEIVGFDFAEWLKNTVSEKDFVVMKMDVEGTEFDLIPRLFETGAICLIDEIFLECHYNRWQRCCPGERSPKYEKTYDQCLELFASLRQSGVLVHQWW